MRRAPEQPAPDNPVVAESGRSAAAGPIREKSPVTQKEAAQLRREKLEAIQLAIARGDYDSDELLEKSMNLLLQRLEQNDQSEENFSSAASPS